MIFDKVNPNLIARPAAPNVKPPPSVAPPPGPALPGSAPIASPLAPPPALAQVPGPSPIMQAPPLIAGNTDSFGSPMLHAIKAKRAKINPE